MSGGERTSGRGPSPREQPRGRDVYLHSIPLQAAQARWQEAWERLGLSAFAEAPSPRLRSPRAAANDPQPPGWEEMVVESALGRVTASPVLAAASSPHYHAAAMDGIAVRAADTTGASDLAPKALRIGVEAVPVNTGDPLPEETDAVIRIEDVAEVAPGTLEIAAAAVPWQHTRVVGEDIVATEVVVPAGQRLRAVDIGALLAASVLTVRVVRQPRVVILPTGPEIVPPGQAKKPGEIPDFNSPMISARLLEDGAAPARRPPLPDDAEAIGQGIAEACRDADLVITLAGASAGARDFTAEAIRTAGELLVHGVAIRPGKPVALGIVAGKPVVALPGYPVSAMLCYDLFVAPLLARMLGLPAPDRPRVRVILSRKVASTAGSEEFLRLRLGAVGGRIIATPSGRGAGLINALARSDGLVVIPSLSEGLPKGAEVECQLLRPEHEVRNTILITGSHDIALDLLAEQIRATFPDANMVSTHVGSMAGLAALREGFCHVSGSHLLDPETGDYNRLHLRQLFADQPVTLVTLAHRQQGLMVAPGNPRGIAGWEDLARPDVTFINRQPGAGTRVLLDFHLHQRSISPDRVRGYSREVYTHLAVASMVANGTADAGLGILAAARALGLDFVPLALERYDLAALPGFWESSHGKALLHALRSPEFRAQLAALGGYDIRETGVRQPA